MDQNRNGFDPPAVEAIAERLKQQPGALWYFGDQDVQLHLAPPALGEHTIDVLRAFGLDQGAIETLLADGVAVQYQP